ncbi:MAG: hypothetical protein K5945_09745, partial [Bacteroidaceae bacterium]|nr:hypothetical protein [Bacteroidaceae bacterium]
YGNFSFPPNISPTFFNFSAISPLFGENRGRKDEKDDGKGRKGRQQSHGRMERKGRTQHTPQAAPHLILLRARGGGSAGLRTQKRDCSTIYIILLLSGKIVHYLLHPPNHQHSEQNVIDRGLEHPKGGRKLSAQGNALSTGCMGNVRPEWAKALRIEAFALTGRNLLLHHKPQGAALG